MSRVLNIRKIPVYVSCAEVRKMAELRGKNSFCTKRIGQIDCCTIQQFLLLLLLFKNHHPVKILKNVQKVIEVRFYLCLIIFPTELLFFSQKKMQAQKYKKNQNQHSKKIKFYEELGPGGDISKNKNKSWQKF